MDRWKLFKDYWRFAVGGAVLMVLLIIWFVPFSQKKETNWHSMADAAGQSSELGKVEPFKKIVFTMKSMRSLSMSKGKCTNREFIA